MTTVCVGDGWLVDGCGACVRACVCVCVRACSRACLPACRYLYHVEYRKNYRDYKVWPRGHISFGDGPCVHLDFSADSRYLQVGPVGGVEWVMGWGVCTSGATTLAVVAVTTVGSVLVGVCRMGGLTGWER